MTDHLQSKTPLYKKNSSSLPYSTYLMPRGIGHLHRFYVKSHPQIKNPTHPQIKNPTHPICTGSNDYKRSRELSDGCCVIM